MGFFPKEYLDRRSSSGSSLDTAVARLNVPAKQAFYAAIEKNGVILRGTWEGGDGGGCAFNKGGEEIGQRVTSYAAAAKAFDMPESDVRFFIRVWDGLPGTNQQATAALKTSLETVGLFEVPATMKVSARIFRSTVYKSWESRMMEQLQEDIADDLIEGRCEAENLLVGV